jgi:hypothetical protein
MKINKAKKKNQGDTRRKEGETNQVKIEKWGTVGCVITVVSHPKVLVLVNPNSETSCFTISRNN